MSGSSRDMDATPVINGRSPVFVSVNTCGADFVSPYVSGKVYVDGLNVPTGPVTACAVAGIASRVPIPTDATRATRALMRRRPAPDTCFLPGRRSPAISAHGLVDGGPGSRFVNVPTSVAERGRMSRSVSPRYPR